MLAGAGTAQEADDGGVTAGNASQAIEITADTLEVRQSERVAVFEGSVNAVQGELVLNADILTVYYRESEGGQGNLGSPASTPRAMSSSPRRTRRRRGNAVPTTSKAGASTWPAA